MSDDPYTPRPQDRFSFGIWTVGWQGVDVFGAAIRPPMDPDRAVHQLAEIGAYGVNFHDNDVFAFDATPPRASRRIAALRAAPGRDRAGRADGHDQPVLAIRSSRTAPSPPTTGTCAGSRSARCCATSTSPPSSARRPYVCWGGREGAESGAAKDVRPPWTATRRRSTSSGSTSSTGYDLRFAIEPKPNEPRGDILLPTIGHAWRSSTRSSTRSLVGLNPEVGHEEMAGLNYAHGIAQALWHGKLFHIDLNGQNGPRFDQDLRFGAGNVRGAFWIVDLLEQRLRRAAPLRLQAAAHRGRRRRLGRRRAACATT